MNQDKKSTFLDSLDSFSSSLKNDSLTRKYLFDLSAEYYYLNKNEKSLAVCQKVLKLSEHAKDTMAIAKSLHYIGDTYDVSQKDSAYYYYHQAEKLYHILDNKDLAGKMNIQRQRLDTWFYQNLKKIRGLRKVGPGHYHLKG